MRAYIPFNINLCYNRGNTHILSLRPFSFLQASGGLRILLIPAVVLTAIVTMSAYFFVRGQAIMEHQLREQLRQSAALAAQQFDADQLNAIQTAADTSTLAYRLVTQRLVNIKNSAPSIRFAYIMRRTNDAHQLAFVADASAALAETELDINQNGVIDPEEEPSYPGDLYDTSGAPALAKEAFLQPTVDPEVTIDKWGSLISGYAPIRNNQGKVVAVIGLDMDAQGFYAATQSVFSPFGLLIVILAAVAIGVYMVQAYRTHRFYEIQHAESERAAFLDLASHQLGVPLAIFRWWLDILREEDHGKFAKPNGICDQMQRGVDRLDGIIQSLRDAGRLRTGNYTYHSKKVDIAQIATIVAEQVRPAFALRSQSLTLTVEKNLPHLELDPKLIGGVIDELLENASIYSPEHASIEMRIFVKRGGVQVEVEDNGRGIPEKDLLHIFEEFRRGSNAALSKPVGNGLGLSIAKGIVQRAGGKIWVKSQEGKRTTFFVWLPAK